jgi:hypothetical protein
MQKLIYILLTAILIQSSHAEDKIKISINKDKNGKITLVSSGHSVPISFDIMGKSYDVPSGGGSVEVESKEFESKTETELDPNLDVNAESGSENRSSNISQPFGSQQFNSLLIPPVNSNPNPLEATPI